MDNELRTINSQEQYIKLFEDYKSTRKHLLKDSEIELNIFEEALKHALDVRKFEIQLYWERAKYFWGFISVIFAGYFVVINSGIKNGYELITVVISIIGLFFSLGWYLANRGSKYWQKNWEEHVNILEDISIGPLFKTVLNPWNTKLSRISMEYPFSVSKVNQILSLLVFFIWVFIFSFSIDSIYKFTFLDEHAEIINKTYFGFLIVFCFYQLLINSQSKVFKDIKKSLDKESNAIFVVNMSATSESSLKSKKDNAPEK